MASTPPYRPLRSLLLLFVILVSALSWIVVKDLEPKLGLDLRGGTSVILTPDPAKTVGRVTQARLDKAVDIISQRVNGTGVAEAEVVREGGNILVALPSVGRDEALDLVGRTAQLTFRPILSSAAGDPDAPVPTDEPSVDASIGADPSASGTAAPTASARASASPAATGATATDRPSPTANGRAMSSALLAQAATPTATPTPAGSAAPTPRGSAAPSVSASPGGAADVIALQEQFNALDCTDAEQVAAVAAQDDPAKSIIACERDGSVKYILGPAEVTGTALQDANATINQQTGAPEIAFETTDDGSKLFGEVTKKYQGQPLAIVLDGIVQSAPTIQAEITDEGQITGEFTDREAKDLAAVLKFGALPLAFEQSQTQTISPTLGDESLDAGMLAGILGISIVVLYLLAYYRALGLVVTSGLAVFGLLNYSAVVLLGASDVGFTLTLAGIVGLIVSIGISGDSYVVFFERIKDEQREGRSPRVAVDRGYVGARRTILTANFVSFLAAATLYLLSVGAVRGFAFTLGLATLIDVVVFFLFTRPVTTMLARSTRFAEGRRFGIRSLSPPRTTAAAASSVAKEA